MKRLRVILVKVQEALLGTERMLEKAQHRYQENRKRAFQANNKKKVAQKKAQSLRNRGHIHLAEQEDAAAGRQAHKATKNHERAQYWLGRIKVLTQKKDRQLADVHQAEADIAKYRKEHGVEVSGNKVTGGTARQRLRVAMHESWHWCASGRRFNFYSQSGPFDVDHCITGPSSSHRDDCSSWGTSVHKSAGLDDPNGEGFGAGYTGTIMAHCETISKAEAQTGDFIVYLSFPGDKIGHHTELVDDPERETTIGHGSAPVDPGVYDLFGNGLFVFKRNPALRPR